MSGENDATPNGCSVCGDAPRSHAMQYHASVGYHAYTEPTDEQRKRRMLARRAERLSTYRDVPLRVVSSHASRLDTRVFPPEVPRDRAPRDYAEQRALLDDSLRNIPPGSTERGERPRKDAGWFADVAVDAPAGYPWQPCLETGTGRTPCFNMWFKTREECEAYIRDTILPIAGTVLP